MQRIISWQTRSPVLDSSAAHAADPVGGRHGLSGRASLMAIADRHLFGLPAVFSWFDQIGTFVSR
jgi:hypothetical protein